MSYFSSLLKRITNRDYLSQSFSKNSSNNNRQVETPRSSSKPDNTFVTWWEKSSYQDDLLKIDTQGLASLYYDNSNRKSIENTIFSKASLLSKPKKNSPSGRNPKDIALLHDNANINKHDGFLNTSAYFITFSPFHIFGVNAKDVFKRVAPQKTDIAKAGEYGEKHKINEITLPDGTIVVGHSYSNFNQCQEQWLYLQKYMVQAANELGLTLVYSDVCRTVKQSNKSRAKKGNHVAAGGSSPHNYGVAADIILLKDGKRINEKSDLQAQFAKRVSELSDGKIAWGGDKEYYPKLYKKERHHFELRDWNVKNSENYCKNRDNLIDRLA